MSAMHFPPAKHELPFNNMMNDFTEWSTSRSYLVYRPFCSQSKFVRVDGVAKKKKKTIKAHKEF